MEQKANRRYQLLVLIASPKLTDKAADLFLKSALPIQYRFYAEGTASSQIMDTLGLGSSDKGVLISTVPESFGKLMLGKLHSELRLDAVNSGIAFTIPLTAANNLLLRMMTHTAEVIEGSDKGRKEIYMSESTYVLIAAIVNRGFGGEVMDAARAAGARGGTLMHSRSIGSEEATNVWGLGVHEEKELVLILADHEMKVGIMRAISERCGMHSEAEGLVLSLPIDSVMGI
ncbi:MAG: hypothetical protein IJP15_06360 [Oscillospiraceae bacterium]|nr:hypothetical protein [Oscillospiraceae bacterium]